MTCGRPTRDTIIWNNSKVKMILPAVSEGETLDLVSKLCGTYEAERQTAVEGQGRQRLHVDRPWRRARPFHPRRSGCCLTSPRLSFTAEPPAGEGVDRSVLGAEIGQARAEAKAAKRAAQTPPPSAPPPRPGGRPVPNNCNRWRRSTSCRVTPERAREKSRVAADDRWEVLEVEVRAAMGRQDDQERTVQAQQERLDKLGERLAEIAEIIGAKGPAFLLSPW